ncbi:hypothetical protein SASPL_154503 [Salvia splendens]|uniref:Uncharacterized protein n=1 Tax=Salvia splendens TaxID=180675 RepID=A0A8X8YZW1_SALSN|nr:hypothetical protein SASPL_154503 [Salvia splendens]
MEMYAKLMQHRNMFIASIAASLSLALVLSTSTPLLSTIFNYFWPLLLSTAMVLVAIVVIARISPINLPEFSGDKEGEALLDYVTGQHAEFLENY